MVQQSVASQMCKSSYLKQKLARTLFTGSIILSTAGLWGGTGATGVSGVAADTGVRAAPLHAAMMIDASATSYIKHPANPDKVFEIRRYHTVQSSNPVDPTDKTEPHTIYAFRLVSRSSPDQEPIEQQVGTQEYHSKQYLVDLQAHFRQNMYIATALDTGLAMLGIWQVYGISLAIKAQTESGFWSALAVTCKEKGLAAWSQVSVLRSIGATVAAYVSSSYSQDSYSVFHLFNPFLHYRMVTALDLLTKSIDIQLKTKYKRTSYDLIDLHLEDDFADLKEFSDYIDSFILP